MDLEAVARDLCGAGELLDRVIDLVGHERVEAEHVMRGFARAPAVHPLAVLQLVALPRLSGSDANQQSDERGETRVGTHQPENSETIAVQRPCAFRINS